MLKKDMELIERIPSPEVDINTLKGVLEEYSKPYEKISSWVDQGVLIRMARGWYVLGKEFRKRPLSREYIANVLYGSSYISLDYALSFYSLIPERVMTVTSVTTMKTRIIDTPLGRFSYRKVPERVYRTGMDLHLPETGPSFFIATPEKALADKVNQFFALDETRGAGLYDLLVHNLRIEPSSLSSLDYSLLEEISQVYRSRKVSALAEFVRKLQKKGSTQ
jgi:hypothetical protein